MPIPGDCVIREGVASIDFPRVTAWLAASYWSPGTTRDVVERAAAGSALVISVYLAGQQVAYCRVISDCATFAWIADVIVDPQQRGRGIGQEMIRYAQAHPRLQGLRRWVLATQDAHGVYAKCGFTPLPYPERFMLWKPG